jgi:hypothetical protein
MLTIGRQAATNIKGSAAASDCLPVDLLDGKSNRMINGYFKSWAGGGGLHMFGPNTTEVGLLAYGGWRLCDS